ncbi:MAG: hypothetical protein AAGF12_38120 [Myxococcota bacterium]
MTLGVASTLVIARDVAAQPLEDPWYPTVGVADPDDQPTWHGSGESALELLVHFREEGAEDLVHLAPRVRGFWDANDTAGIGFDAVFLWLSVEDGSSASQSLIQIGNVLLHARLRHSVGPLRLRYEPGVALPTAWIPDNDPGRAPTQRLAYRVAASARGFSGLYRFRPETFGLFARVIGILEASRDARLLAMVSVATSLALADEGDTAELDLEARLGLEFGPPERYVEVGYVAVFFPTGAGGDRAQSSLRAGGRLTFGRAFLLARVSVNLDGPEGVFGDAPRGYGASVGVGATL